MDGRLSNLLDTGRLIEEVCSRPELWDRQHPQHHNRSVLDHHWEDVAGTLSINGKTARGKWKNLKDHFRKEYKRCLSLENGQDISKWPYFQSMMFIKDQISHSVSNSLYLADIQFQNIYPEVEMTEGVDEDKHSNSTVARSTDNGVEICSSSLYQDENFSDDKHFLLSLLPTFSALSPEKKLKARIAIETLLLKTAYPEVLAIKTEETLSEVNQSNVDKCNELQPVKTATKRKRKSAVTKKYC
ncbi:uncharacterized protein LOC126895464 [Daktulosphaira vitifoliae]|uniref:uncharacterized protein LOC126895464 n=1 Tax=Daktulosphaira vitifoliae TaxID=58002 RepID=UPI0021AAB40E|nr:uncharacterized protein LOC126895464 [Daktulosphaira vitifoliae]